ncbi:MAG TPA: DUF418 domain-containing protein [Gemmatimonadales bacterium]|nr:DUF418 domain-containing protein [Gemmatimonadales bacterium]
MTTTTRIEALDALRGLALVGILIANVPIFAGVVAIPPETAKALPTAAFDQAAGLAIWTLVSAKFYSIFSLLFGIGFALILANHPPARFVRRMLALLLIGLLHSALWFGDILVLYAVMGLCLLPARHWSDTALLRGVMLCLIAPAVVWAIWHPVMTLLGQPEFWIFDTQARLTREIWPAYDAAVQRGDLVGLLRWNVEDWIYERLPYFITSGRPFRVFAMFLLGLWVGRRGIAANLAAHRPLLRHWAYWGLGLGLPLNLAYALTPPGGPWWQDPVVAIVEPFASALLAVGYAAGVGLLMARPTPPAWLSGLAPLGRIALTAYLTQTLVMLWFWSGLATGWYGTVGLSLVLLSVPVLILVQLAFARAWLMTFRQGPLEWAWRRLQ